MRTSHRESPLHRIEFWTGEFFRPAQLWETGAYVLVPHCTGEGMCPSLNIQITMLEAFQRRKDNEEESDEVLLASDEEPLSPTNVDPEDGEGNEILPTGNNSEDKEDDGFLVTVNIGNRMHQLFTMGNGEGGADAMEEPDEKEDFDREDDEATYAAAADPEENFTIPDAPSLPHMDAMANDYVRIVHTNGIHYIPLVICDCQGVISRDKDLMYARLVPTSFVRYRTLFTTAVLDHYRMTNLECKSSAFQYWQTLSRMTSPTTSPSDMDNFCRELRRLSRCWRWLKKLKWAGFGNKDSSTWSPIAGELAIFCPTCPQPGVNLPSNWMDEENK